MPEDFSPAPLVSILTLNYNQADVTCEFLLSTKKMTYPNYEILVCDMSSTENPSEKINKLGLTNTKIYLSDKNLGFAGGNNWGAQFAKGDYIFIVNNDTEVTATLLQDLLKPFYADSSIGVTCPKIKYFFHPNVIQYAGFNKMNLYTGRTSTVGDKEEDYGQYDESNFTFGAHGCAMMVKKEVIDKTGMFPALFFLYYEEWDWSARILKAGYKIFYQASAVIYHKESMSVGKNSLLKTYYLTRNRILYIRRNASIFQLSIFYIFFLFLTVPKTVLGYLVRKQYKEIKTFLKAVTWNFSHSSHSEI